MQLMRERHAEAGTSPSSRRVPRMARCGSRIGDRSRSLEHASGLPARLVDAPPTGRREFEHEICAMPLEVRATVAFDLQRSWASSCSVSCGGSRGRVAGNAVRRPEGPAKAGRHVRCQTLTVVASGFSRTSRSCVRSAARSSKLLPRRRCRWTTIPRRGRLLRGEVHDNYAAALAGVAGHAGLFGSAPPSGGSALPSCRGARDCQDGLRVSVFAWRWSSTYDDEERGPWELARARMGYDAAHFVVRHADVAGGASAMSALPAPRSGSIPCAIATTCCWPTVPAAAARSTTMRDVRRAFHDALADA